MAWVRCFLEFERRWLVVDDDRRKIDARVNELRLATESDGWNFRIVDESAIEVVYETRRPGGTWRRVSVRADGEC